MSPKSELMDALDAAATSGGGIGRGLSSEKVARKIVGAAPKAAPANKHNHELLDALDEAMCSRELAGGSQKSQKADQTTADLQSLLHKRKPDEFAHAPVPLQGASDTSAQETR